ncbi:MAG: inositol oxygenase [Acidobacteria bacterium]|nr:inositol oxygenase [Acidobacteriota bacterium]MCI0664743.1 inositol oxygenase [Acidobacteriota bacterium]
MSNTIHQPDFTGDATQSSFLSHVKNAESYRNYDAEARSCVKELYRLNHKNQTLDFVLKQKAEYGKLNRAKMGIWEAMEFLNRLVDDSDPDIDLTQIDHALQTAEAIRQDGHPRWFILTGLIHDLGKVLCLYGEPQWAVVGDTFPVGCAYSEKIVYPEFFQENPDFHSRAYQTPTGIYEEGCGLDNVNLSWGHDEFLYTVVKDYLPPEALWMIRYHSCYPIHREGAYTHLLNEQDQETLKWVRAFNPYDLYSKCEVKPDLNELKPFYQELIGEFFPPKIAW